MRVVIQRVNNASVTIDEIRGSVIKNGLLLLVGFETADNEDHLIWMAKKIVQLRIFDDDSGVMNCSILDLYHSSISEKPGILVVSQFTLFALTKKGNRPSYIRAAPPQISIPLYEGFVQKIRSLFPGSVETGKFGAEMKVELVNDGPVTIWIDSNNKE